MDKEEFLIKCTTLVEALTNCCSKVPLTTLNIVEQNSFRTTVAITSMLHQELNQVWCVWLDKEKGPLYGRLQ